MRSREITVGRAAKDHMVDVDLTLEVVEHLFFGVGGEQCSLNRKGSGICQEIKQKI
jgi:hypothetical protein